MKSPGSLSSVPSNPSTSVFAQARGDGFPFGTFVWMAEVTLWGNLLHMSRELILTWNGESAKFDYRKIDRRLLYGAKRRIAVDAHGHPCTRAAMTPDGSTVLRPGMTAQGWFTAEGEQVESAEVVTVDAAGHPLPLHPPTVGVEQPLEGPVDARLVLDHAIEAVMALTPQSLPEGLRAALEAGQVFRFTYCYRAEPAPPTAFLVGNAEGIFALVGQRTNTQWMSRDTTAADVASSADEDDLDFDMV